ncbi:hypothetical protein NC652_035604 [Populus alba x Populus x berolinensis]|nr:hypothetical protein NC652_035604 [Populus alba x Populus x berolinensis]
MGESPSRKAIRRTSRRSVPTKAALTQSQEVLLALWIASYPQVSSPEPRQES